MLSGKVVVITGGAGLLGREFADAVSGQRGITVIADIDVLAAKRTCALLRSRYPGVEPDFYPLDITSDGSLEEMIGVLHERHGRIDALVNNAYPKNRNFGRKFHEVEYGDFCESMNLHLGGYFLSSQRMAAYFKKQGHGNLINIASVYGIVAPRFEVYEGTEMTMPVEYAVIKSGIIHLTKYLAKVLKGTGIRVNAISPGGILNGQPESFLDRYAGYCLSKGMLDGEDLKGTLTYLLSDMSMCVNGQNIIVDDGFSL